MDRVDAVDCHLFLWSTAGADYCRKVAHLNGLTGFFEGFTAKPDIVIDDTIDIAPLSSSMTCGKSDPGAL